MWAGFGIDDEVKFDTGVGIVNKAANDVCRIGVHRIALGLTMAVLKRKGGVENNLFARQSIDVAFVVRHTVDNRSLVLNFLGVEMPPNPDRWLK
jgi:hypothetical protein